MDLENSFTTQGNYSTLRDISSTAMDRIETQMDDSELSDIQTKEIGDIFTKGFDEKTTVRQYLNKAGEFVVGIDLFSEEAKAKAEERIRRFGQIVPPENLLSDDVLDGLHKSLGIVNNELMERSNIRYGVIHMQGTDELSTQDIFGYFKEFLPNSIEWINDHSCNIVWSETMSAARAMLKLSVGMKDNIEMNEEMDVGDDEQNVIRRYKDNFFQNGKWRIGELHPKSKMPILMRFATTDDKKQVGANNKSKYYIQHGNPNYGGLKGLITKGCKQRIIKQQKRKDKSSPVNNKNANNDDFPTRKRSSFNKESKFDMHIRDIDHRRRTTVMDRLEQTKDRRTSEWDDNDVTMCQSGHLNTRDADDSPRSKVPRMRMYADEEDQTKRRMKGLIWERLGCQDNRIERSEPL